MKKWKQSQKNYDYSSQNNLNSSKLIFKTEQWLEKRKSFLFILFTILCFLFSFLLFNVRVSEGGDDSAYIKAGYDYIHEFPNFYFSFNAPLYPMFLIIPIAVGGINIILLKLFSVVFHFLSFLFFYKAFYKRVPHMVFYPVIFFYTVNYMMQYYASQTYNESFYLCFQSLFFYTFFKLNDYVKDNKDELSKTWLLWLAIGFLSLILSLSKNIGIVIIPMTALFLLIQKKWKNVAYYLISFTLFKAVFEFLKLKIWGNISQYQSQGNVLRLKDPYDASKGYDNFAGFVQRFFDNSNLYLSKRFFQIIGFRSEESFEIYPLLTFLLLGIVITGAIYILKQKHQELLFSLLLLIALVGTTFIVLQTRWDQSRLILIHMPLILLIGLYGFYHLFKKSSFASNIYIFFVLIICSSIFISSTKRSAKNIPILKKNLEGNIYYGFTNDWINFLKMSEWCGNNLPDTALVVSRKAPMSFIYAKGKEFYPMYKPIAIDTVSNFSNPDSVLAIFKRSKVTHVILASLRNNPTKADGNIINTVHRVIYPVMQKYPEKIKLIHQIPSPDQPQIEPAYLYQIIY